MSTRRHRRLAGASNRLFAFALLTGIFFSTQVLPQPLPTRLGDLNGDEEVNVLDLVILINHINAAQSGAGVSPAGSPGILPGELVPFADMNGDAFVNQTDIDLLADVILGLPLSSRPITFEPASGSSEVGVTVRPKATFPRPIDVSTLNSNNFYASFAGQKLPARIVPAPNGTFAWLFFDPSMPNASQVQITVDGATIRTLVGTPLDADGDGAPGGVARASFSTVSVVGIPGTAVSSRIVDPGPDLVPRTTDDVTLGNGCNYLLPIAATFKSSSKPAKENAQFLATTTPHSLGSSGNALLGSTGGHSIRSPIEST